MKSAVLFLALVAGAAQAQDCPVPKDVKHAQMLGLWRAEFDGLFQGATVLLEPHPEDKDRFSGGVNRAGEKSILAAEIVDGEFLMEESDDGTRISGAWTGELVAAGCGREIRGIFRPEVGDQTERGFVLRKVR